MRKSKEERKAAKRKAAIARKAQKHHKRVVRAMYGTVIIDGTVTKVELNKGHLSEHHIASHNKKIYDPQGDTFLREEAIQFEIMESANKYKQNSDRKGLVVTPITRESGVLNKSLHSDMATWLQFMKPGTPSPRLLFNSAMTMPPLNKRGKHIRPLEIYLKRATNHKGEPTFRRVRSAVGYDRRSVILPQETQSTITKE